MATHDTLPPSADDLERLARAAIARLPDAFRAHVGDIVLRIEEFATDDVLAELGMDDPFELTGLYHGRPLGEKSVADVAPMPDAGASGGYGTWIVRSNAAGP